MTEVLDTVGVIWTQYEEKHQVNLPEWWLIILEEMEPNQFIEDESQWQELRKQMQKLITFWQKKLKKWAISSFTMFSEKMSKHPAGTLRTSLSQNIKDQFLGCWDSLVNTEDLDEVDCLEYRSKMTISTSSTIAHLEGIGAGTASGTRSSLSDTLCQLAGQISPYMHSNESSGTMSSSISFLENGELVKYGLEEKVGKRRLTVSNNNRLSTKLFYE